MELFWTGCSKLQCAMRWKRQNVVIHSRHLKNQTDTEARRPEGGGCRARNTRMPGGAAAAMAMKRKRNEVRALITREQQSPPTALLLCLCICPLLAPGLPGAREPGSIVR